MKKELNEFLLERRKGIPKLTIGKLSLLSGLSSSVISRYESGKRRPGQEALSRLAHHLKVNHQYLLFLAGYISKEDWNKIRKQPDVEKVFVKEKEGKYISDLDHISKEEEDLLTQFRALKTKKLKTGLLTILEGILEMKQK